jgi:hypothetical protein
MIVSFICRAACGVLAAAALIAPALAGTQTFVNPTQGPNRLDWCYDWAVGCGQQAADAWCVSKGFQNATAFDIANDIGGSSPTRIISTGAVCDQAFCDGFSYITCFSATTATFNNPMYNGNRLDWCVNWGVGCGQEAADKYCQSQGYGSAANLQIANDIGAGSPTRLIGTGAVCDQAFCDGFTFITCQ